MEIMIFGHTKSPAIDFTFDPVEGLRIDSRECFCLNYTGITGTLTWRDFFPRVTPDLARPFGLDGSDRPTRELLAEATSKLLACTATPAERAFFEQYLRKISKGSSASAEELLSTNQQPLTGCWRR